MGIGVIKLEWIFIKWRKTTMYFQLLEIFITDAIMVRES